MNHAYNQAASGGMNNQTQRTKGNMLALPTTSLMALSGILTLAPYKHRKDLVRESVLSKYEILGYIAAGTYGKVYKAKSKTSNKRKIGSDRTTGDVHNGQTSTSAIGMDREAGENAVRSESDQQLYAIKKFKSDNHLSKMNSHDINGNEVVNYTGISQSAIREMSLCRELSNRNVIKVIDILLENKAIYMVFEYCEHDLLQIIQCHSHPEIKHIPDFTIKSLVWQILNGVSFLHKNWIFHRDLKPANIMVSSSGVVKIGDLGLARRFNNPLQSLYTGDKVVVTIWYRAPELLLGGRHYTPAIDLWAVGCILAELLSLRPIFKGEEAKIDMSNKKQVPFQRNQIQKIVEILGTPNSKTWPSITMYPEYPTFKQCFGSNLPSNLSKWYELIGRTNQKCFNLLEGLFEYDPTERLAAENALLHPFFLEPPRVTENAFEGLKMKYPRRRIFTDDNDIVSNNNYAPHKRHAHDDNFTRKRQK